MAGRLIEEPKPKLSPDAWSAWIPAGVSLLPLKPPATESERGFAEVLRTRRSRPGGDLDWNVVADLLWFSSRTQSWEGVGRAGIEVEHRASPSAGGLHPVSVVCQMTGSNDRPRLYLAGRHTFAVLEDARGTVQAANRHQINDLLGTDRGCTLRFIGDYDKTSAAYDHAESLLWRDAGALASVICLVSEWLQIECCPLGLAGTDFIDQLGFPVSRFIGLGAVQIGSR